jgi:hypothetical protein
MKSAAEYVGIYFLPALRLSKVHLLVRNDNKGVNCIIIEIKQDNWFIKMTRKEAIEVYKTQHERFRQTKELQWKINLASWALIALGINYSEKIRNQLNDKSLFSFVLIFFVAQMIFSFRTQRALEADKIISREILKQLNINTEENLNIQIDINKLTRKIYFGATGWWWVFFQALTTGILLFFFYMLAK